MIFKKFIEGLVGLFASKTLSLDERGSFIIRQLSTLIKPQRLFTALAIAIANNSNFVFVQTFVHKLNYILFVAPELHAVRQQLKTMLSKGSQDLFVLLYKAWCPSAISTVALCILAQQYEHASALLAKLGDLDMAASHVAEASNLANLVETAVFNFARLQSLDTQRHAHLIKALFGLLMLLPSECKGFTALKRRIDSISHRCQSMDPAGSMGSMGSAANKEGLTDAKAIDFEVGCSIPLLLLPGTVPFCSPRGGFGGQHL